MLTSSTGAGSILFIQRHPTDYELRQLKTPNGEFTTLRYQLARGGSASLGGDDPFVFVVRQAGEMGISTPDAARGVSHPDGSPVLDKEVEQARRHLYKQEERGLITHDGEGRKLRWLAL